VARDGKRLAQIARELGINQQVLRNWKQSAASGGSGVTAGNPPRRVADYFTQEEEIRRLRRDLFRVTAGAGDPNNATAFFAHQSR
jgi:transposase-like protein